MLAAFHRDWDIQFGATVAALMTLLRKAPTAALVYDWDSGEGDWRLLCKDCAQYRVPFYLAATKPPDDLFLAVAGAGGSGVLWKPFSADQIIAAIDSARID
jgi:hypothetical protein